MNDGSESGRLRVTAKSTSKHQKRGKNTGKDIFPKKRIVDNIHRSPEKRIIDDCSPSPRLQFFQVAMSLTRSPRLN